MKGRMPQKSNFLLIAWTALCFVLSVHPFLYGNKALFEGLSVDQGLSHNQINVIRQDRRGFIWIGTRSGLNRYDGLRFVHFSQEAGHPRTLSDNRVNDLLEDRDGILWIATGNGLNRLDPMAERITVFESREGDTLSLSNRHVVRVVQDSELTLWVGTSWGLNRLNSDQSAFRQFLFDPESPDGPDKNRIWDMTADDSGHLWIGTDAGLRRFDTRTGDSKVFRRDDRNPHSLDSDRIRAVLFDSRGRLWVGTQGGLNRMHPETGRCHHYRYGSQVEKGLSRQRISVLAEDRHGNVWVGTEWGLNRITPGRETIDKFYHDPANPYSLSNNFVSAIAEGKSGILWFGTYHAGVNKFAPHKQLFRSDPFLTIQGGGGASDRNIISLCEYDRDQLWVGTYDGLFIWNRKTQAYSVHTSEQRAWLAGNFVRALHKDRRGSVWIGVLEGAESGLGRYDPVTGRYRFFPHVPENPNSLSSNDITAILQDQAGTIWVGTDGHGLNRLNPQTGEVRRYDTLLGVPGQIASKWISVIFEDSRSRLWVGTDQGMSRFIPETESFENFLTDPQDKHSLSGMRIHAIHEDRRGRFWIGTENGLDRFAPDSSVFHRFSDRHEFPSRIIYAILEDESGHLWVSTSKGIVRINPDTGECNFFDDRDGLRVTDFNTGVALISGDGEAFFGGKTGLIRFRPDAFSWPHEVPPVTITDFRVHQETRHIGPGLAATRPLILKHDENTLSFEFAVLDFVSPEKNRASYKLEGLDRQWIDARDRPFVRYTNLDPGDYVFRVKGANAQGTWNEKGVAFRFRIQKPFWETVWFRSLGLLLGGMAIWGLYTLRIRQHALQKKKLEKTVADRTQEIAAKNEALSRSREEYARLFNDAPICYHELDMEGRILRVNTTEAETLGYTVGEMLGRSIFDFIADEEREAARQNFTDRVSKTDQIDRFERQYMRKDGKPLFFSISSRLYHDQESQRTVVRSALEDITERKALETQLRQSQKMEAVGRLAGGVAHDFNNLLTVIRGHASLIKSEMIGDHPLYEEMELIEEAGDKAAQLTRRLLAFSRKQQIRPEILDLNRLIQSLSKTLTRLIGEDIVLETRLEAFPWSVEVDPDQIEQILMHLAVNARDAMPDGGRLLIETRNTVLDDHYCEHHLDIRPGPYVLMAVSDTGLGMDPATREHLFEPFFTTKDQPQGTGLGLPMVYGIVKQSDGHIEVYSEPGHGSSFKIYFPSTESERTEKQAEPDKQTVSGGSETVLVLEDDENVRRFVVRALRKYGFEVLEAHDYASALRTAREHESSIHLILSDVIMPDMNGPDIVRELNAFHPDAGVLYMSGYNDDIISHQGILHPGVHFIQKPFVIQNLIDKIRAVLDHG